MFFEQHDQIPDLTPQDPFVFSPVVWRAIPQMKNCIQQIAQGFLVHDTEVVYTLRAEVVHKGGQGESWGLS